jgi:hypothetical protein
MADISAFPTLKKVLVKGSNVKSYKAGAAIKAGQVVCFEATGVTDQVIPSVNGAGTKPAGVAIYDAASGAQVAVAGEGCEVYVVNADDTTALDAGDRLQPNDAAVGGTVNAQPLTASGATATSVEIIGVLQEDVAGGGTGRAVLEIYTGTIPNAS